MYEKELGTARYSIQMYEKELGTAPISVVSSSQPGKFQKKPRIFLVLGPFLVNLHVPNMQTHCQSQQWKHQKKV